MTTLKKLIPKDVLKIIRKLQKHGEAYIVGGACRDMMFDRLNSYEDKKYPIKDWDIVTSLTPEEIKKIYPKSTTCGNSFLVSLVDGFEIATFRTDKEDHAEVAHTLEEDVARRDFTINAMAINPIKGTILDSEKGIEDTDEHILRFVGNPARRIKEDSVRIIRGLRFAAKYNLVIEPNTYLAMQSLKELINEVPGERIRLEIIKAFKSEGSHRFLMLLKELNMLFEVFPTLCSLENIDGGPHHNESVLQHCFNAVKAVDSSKNYLLKLACLYHDIGKNDPMLNDEGENIFYDHHLKGQDCIEFDLGARLHFTNDEVKYVKFMARHHMDSIDSKKSIKKLFTRLTEYDVPLRDFLLLRYADKKGNLKTTNDVNFLYIKNKYKECLTILNTKPPAGVNQLEINGRDVMCYFDLAPGKEIGVMLHYALDGVLSDVVKNEKEALLDYLERGYC